MSPRIRVTDPFFTVISSPHPASQSGHVRKAVLLTATSLMVTIAPRSFTGRL
jgi:hypothetical protein